MKKLLSLGVLSLSVVALVACSQSSSGSSDTSSKSEANVPTEYKTAVKKAKQYANTIHMSKEGLRTQLVDIEKYSQEAADYAVDNADIDYSKQAIEKAKQYQETIAMSPEAIRTQLVDIEKFTQEEADNAVANLN